jgi:hypothetical protein
MALVVGTNSYLDVTDADLYFDARLHSDNWTNAESADKEKALIHATRMIDDLFEWPGDIADDDQDLAWPRSGVYDSEGREIDETVIPDEIKEATCEQAIYLLGSIDPNQIPDLVKQGFKRAKLGPMEIETDRTMIPDMMGPAVKIKIGVLGTQKSSATISGSFQGSTIRN